MDNKDSKLNLEIIYDLLNYVDGKLFWKKNQKEAGWVDSLYYRNLGINGYTYKTHRIIFFIHNNYWPKCIDHIDNNSLNNHISNLRDASCMQNSWNQKNRITNRSGFKGVGWNVKTQSWGARCMLNYHSYFLGRYKEKEDAIKIVEDFRKTHQGEYARNA